MEGDDVLMKPATTLDDVLKEVRELHEEVRRLEKQVPVPGLPIGWDMVNRCAKCGIALNGVMCYVCTSAGCPTGLGGIYS
jgi:hypothetical protein